MVEEIQKIRAEDITIVRIVFENGQVHEMPVSALGSYAGTSSDENVKNHLGMLAQCLLFFSAKTTKPSIEFVIPVKR